MGTDDSRAVEVHRRPLLAAAISLAAGSALPLGTTGPVPWLLALAAILAGAVFLRPDGRARGIALTAIGIALGVTGATLEEADYDVSPLRRIAADQAADAPALALAGSLAEDPDVVGGRAVLVVDVDSAGTADSGAASGRVRAFVAGNTPLPTLIEGDRVRFAARLALPAPPRNPGGFDASAHARRNRVHATGYVKSALLVERADGRRESPAARIACLRQFVRETLLAHLHPGPDAGIVRAMVLGDRAGLDAETEETFRVSGTYHVLALSGAQVALVAGLLLWGARWMRASLGVETALTVGGVLLYALFVGGDVPVLRAALMATVLLIGRALGLVGDAANLLGLAALLLLVYRPSWTGDVGFQLSFAATLSIILITPLVSPLFGRLPRWLGLSLAASIAAQLGVLPLLALHFNRVTPLAPLLNLAAVPLSSVILLAGFACVLTAWAGPVALGCAYVAEGAARLMRLSGAAAQCGSWADVRVPTPGVPLLLLYAVGLVALVAVPRRRGRAALLLLFALAGLVWGTGGPIGDGRLRLSILDVGRGDGLVLQSPKGRVMVIDTGGVRPGGPAVAETATAPFLWGLGLGHIDRLVLTHPHADHVGGATFLRQAFDVREIWMPPAPPDDGDWGALAADPQTRTVSGGRREPWDGIVIEALWPPGVVASANAGSLVLRLRFRQVVLLLAGDIDAGVEAALPAGPADLLKVPHHGSRSSSTEEFVRRVSPRLAVVSCGRPGASGGADPGVLELYRRYGARVIQTSEGGAVRITTDGARVVWETASGLAGELTARLPCP